MIYKSFQDTCLSRLGMGNMRLPQVDSADRSSPIDWVKAHEIIDCAYENGVTYFDTAYVYNNGESERCLGACMTKYPRDSFRIATKWHIHANPDYKAVFEEELKRLQTDHVDFYLIHCLLDGNFQAYIDSGAIAWLEEQKRLGRIRYLGFSSHASPETLEKFASLRSWDFAQIQLNYYDWIYGTSRQEYEILTSKNIPVIVMEPVRGGKLACLTPKANEILKAAHPEWSIASWALRFVKSLPNVQVILSGMSDMAQIRDNLATFSEDSILNEQDNETLMAACREFHNALFVPCTACRYCCKECPMEINIPEFMNLYNSYRLDGDYVLSGIDKIQSSGRPADCIGCGACAAQCPQSIEIPTIMAELARLTAK